MAGWVGNSAAAGLGLGGDGDGDGGEMVIDTD
jgi:hypothetical protein